MKMSEFLKLSDAEKMEFIPDFPPFESATEDLGKCVQCGGEASVGDYCFGCHQLVCQDCIEKEPHLLECWMKPL